MNILVTGANGFVGRALCDYLSHKGLNAYALLRKPLPDLKVKDQFIASDFLSYNDYKTILKNIDVVIHTAGLAHVKGRPDQDYYDINTEITKRLALECAKAGVKRFVYISSTHVHVSSSCTEILTPRSQFNPTTAYGKSKLLAEEFLREMELKNTLEVVIIRPPLVYGPQAAGNVRLLIKAIQKNIPFPFAGVKNKRSMIFIENLVDAITLASIHPNAKGQTYFVSDGRPLSIEDLVNGLGQGLEKSPILFPFPEFLLRFPLKLIGKEEMLDKITGSLQLDTYDIQHTIGWKPVVSVDEGLARTARSFR